MSPEHSNFSPLQLRAGIEGPITIVSPDSTPNLRKNASDGGKDRGALHSLKSKAFKRTSDAFTRIERKVFDAHLAVDKFNLRRLDADHLLVLCFDVWLHVLPMLNQVLEHHRKALTNGVLDVFKSLLFSLALREASRNLEAFGHDAAVLTRIGYYA